MAKKLAYCQLITHHSIEHAFTSRGYPLITQDLRYELRYHLPYTNIMGDILIYRNISLCHRPEILKTISHWNGLAIKR